jgi:ketosteroid isomerase-like protein
MAQKGGARSGDARPVSSTELVRRAYTAFARRDGAELRRLCHESFELRPVDGLGLVGETLHGIEAVDEWTSARDALGHSASIWPRTLEEVAPDLVLGVGVVSDPGRVGHGFAATVAWLWHIRDGRIDCVHGYPSEAAARRALSDRA